MVGAGLVLLLIPGIVKVEGPAGETLPLFELPTPGADMDPKTVLAEELSRVGSDPIVFATEDTLNDGRVILENVVPSMTTAVVR